MPTVGAGVGRTLARVVPPASWLVRACLLVAALTAAACGAAAGDGSVGAETSVEPGVEGAPGGVPATLQPGDDPDVVLLFGDSVARSVAEPVVDLLASTVVVDAVDCRKLQESFVGPCGTVASGTRVPAGLDSLADLMDDLRGEERVPDVAVIVQANNSNLTADVLDEAMALLPDVDRVWWVTARIDGFGRQDPNNALLADLAAGDERIGVIDWYDLAAGRDDVLRDHVHPNDLGRQLLADLIVAHVRCDCTP